MLETSARAVKRLQLTLQPHHRLTASDQCFPATEDALSKVQSPVLPGVLPLLHWALTSPMNRPWGSPRGTEPAFVYQSNAQRALASTRSAIRRPPLKNANMGREPRETREKPNSVRCISLGESSAASQQEKKVRFAMKRLLFVDDEPKVLEGLENLLFPYIDEWEVNSATSGKEALSLLAKSPYDILVTDMQMPGMDGATLLSEVCRRHPNVVRFVLSGHAEFEAALRALPIAHQFLSKPCNADDLVNVLTRACDLQDLVTDAAVRTVMGKFGDLPARPKVYSEITKLLADDKASMADLAQLVEQDIAITTKLLHVANTAFFSRGRLIKTVRQVVPRLGTACVRDLVLGIEVFKDFNQARMPGFSIDALHERSFLCATLASRICDDRRKSEDAFLAATLQDIGELMLASTLTEDFAAAVKAHTETGRARFTLEHEQFGASHAEIGAYLLGLWGMPYPIIEAVAYHHQPRRAREAGFSLVTILHVANALVEELDSGQPDPNLDLEHLEDIGVADRLDEWRTLARSLSEVRA